LTRYIPTQDYDDESDDGGGSGDEENLHELVDEERPERPTDMLVYALPTQPKGSDIAPVDKHDLASSVKAKSLVGICQNRLALVNAS
jgi:hypothetical protein